jgi:hypothetical protein
MYEALLIVTALSCFAAILAGAWYYHDTFHPLVYLGALLGALYVYFPAYLVWDGGIWQYLDEGSLPEIQAIFLLGVLSILVGVWRGAGRPVGLSTGGTVTTEEQRRRLRIGGAVLGLVAVGGFLYGVMNVGGIQAAFGKSYGGGWDDSGYVRDMPLLSLPALLWLMAAYQTRRPGWIGWVLICGVASPLLVQGILGGRRGPSFMGVVGLTVGWYLMRRQRPRLVTVLAGGAALGMALLFLVANRGEIYLGSELRLEEPLTTFLGPSTSNEYLYGGALVLHAKTHQEYYWGGLYFQLFLVRPIPKELWPTKYEDSSRWLSVPNVELGNSGLPISELQSTVGWAASLGSAPGIVADLWVEFWWLGMAALFGVGWLYGRGWRNAVIQGGPWIPCFGVLTALSIYLVMQDLEAMGYRALLMLAGSTAVWYASKLGGTAPQPGLAELPAQAVIRAQRG